MEEGNYCYICQDFEENVGHAAKWCPKIVCQKCGQKGHVKMGCMLGLEDFPLPNEIILYILSFLYRKDIEQCAKVSKRFMEICDKRLLEEVKKVERDPNIGSRVVKILVEMCPLYGYVISPDFTNMRIVESMTKDEWTVKIAEWHRIKKNIKFCLTQDNLKMLLANFGEVEYTKEDLTNFFATFPNPLLKRGQLK